MDSLYMKEHRLKYGFHKLQACLVHRAKLLQIKNKGL